MAQALDQRVGQLADVVQAAPDGVLLEHRDDLIIRLAGVDHLQTADDVGGEDDLSPVDRPLGDHADIHRIAVAVVRPGPARRPAARSRCAG